MRKPRYIDPFMTTQEMPALRPLPRKSKLQWFEGGKRNG